MNIDLPKKFFYTGKTDKRRRVKDYAIVVENQLEIHGNVAFESLMYALTHCLKGRKCIYCGRQNDRLKMTLDHQIPRALGGPSITNNLVPCCKHCNAEKGDMTPKQYSQYRKLPTKIQRQQFLEQVREHQRGVWKRRGFELPSTWYQKDYTVSNLIAEIQLDWYPETNKDNRIRQFYQQYHRFQRPIIVDRNGYLLSGFKTVMFAKKMGIRKVPAIVLNNVEKFFK